MKTKFSLTCLLFASASSPLIAAPRDIQFRSIDFENSVLELQNFGEDTESLDGWRFCSHDEDQTRAYSLPEGLNGISLAPGESLFVHYLGDAPEDETNRINLPGSFALPLDRGPYGIQIYFPPISFGDGGTIADHVQWAINGVDDTTADERSGAAEDGGLWTDQETWIATTEDASSILLTDTSGAILQGPDNYEVIQPEVAAESSFEIDSIEVSTTGEVTLTWTATPGSDYQVFRAENLDNGADSFGEPIATVSTGSFIDPLAAEGTVFYRVAEIPSGLLTIPIQFANTEASSAENTALGNTSNTVQTVFNESALLTSGIEVGDVLTGLSFRVGAGGDRVAPNFIVDNYIIRLSTSNFSAGNLENVFEMNRGDDLVEVRSGPLTFNAADFDDTSIALGRGPGIPNAFGAVITFDNPFTYNGGNLLLDYTHTAPLGLDGSDLITSAADSVADFNDDNGDPLVETLFGEGIDVTTRTFSPAPGFAPVIRFTVER